MYSIVKKILTTPSPTISPSQFRATDDTYEALGQELHQAIHGHLGRSLAIREVAAGSSNAEEIEMTALGNAFYDVDRFGVHFVASPRHADALFVSGPVARNMAEPLRRTYAAMPEPRIVVAVGDGAIDGGIFKGSYAIAGAVKDVIPVDFEIPGDPPSPQAIITALGAIMKRLQTSPAQSDHQ